METVAGCVEITLATLQKCGIRGEVIVSDNGSSDGSQALAAAAGARVISIHEKGYGCALQAGIAAARGRYVLMGDADLSYDFGELGKFVEKLREGFDLVQGCRLPAGGGTVKPGAMPPSHRWIGNPAFSLMARWMFRAPIHDIYCGMRGFTKVWYEGLHQQCEGMEFAVEMMIRSCLQKGRIAEVPITLHPDGRQTRKPHLRTLRDGWRTLRFFLLYSPRWLYLVPGAALFLFGLAAYGLGLHQTQVLGARLEVHTLLVGITAILLSQNLLLFGLIAKTFAIKEKFLPLDPRLARFFSWVKLENGLLAGGVLCLLGFLAILWVAGRWGAQQFGSLNYQETIPWVGTGLMLTVLGAQTIFSSFIVSMMGLERNVTPKQGVAWQPVQVSDAKMSPH